MELIVEHLGTEVGEIEIQDVHPALVPVEESDSASVGDSQVGGSWVPVDHGNRAARRSSEELEKYIRNVCRECADVGVDAPRCPAQLMNDVTSRPLRMSFERRVHSAELGGDTVPVLR